MTPDPRRPWEIVLAELPAVELDDAPDEDEPAAAWTPPPVVHSDAERQVRLLGVIRAEGPISGRRAASRAGLQKDVGAALVRQLLAARLIRRVDGEGLVSTEDR